MTTITPRASTPVSFTSMATRARSTSKRTPTAELLEMMAGRFRALSEPARLGIVYALEDGPLTVTALVKKTGLGQGNLSKHLQQLHLSGFLSRTRKGLFVYYALADDEVLALCEIMTGRLEHDIVHARDTVTNRRSG